MKINDEHFTIMRKSILSFAMLEKLHPGRFTYPASTAQVLDQLSKRGVHITTPNVERLLRIHQLAVPLLGKTRAWGPHQVESFLDAIVRIAVESSRKRGTTPSWMMAFAAKFYAMDIAADAWCENFIKFSNTFLKDKRPCSWHDIPPGTRLVVHGDPMSVDFVPIRNTK